MGTDNLAGAPTSIDGQLESARASLAQLRAKYTDDHPDIKALKDNIARLEKLKKDMGAEAKENLESNSATPAQVAAMTPMMQVQSQLKANKLEIQGLEAKIQQLQASAQQYQQRLSETPAVEAQMEDLMRDYQSSQKDYADLLAKKQQSALATSLQRQQQGEQFRIIDPPSSAGQAFVPGPLQVLAGWIGGGNRFWRCCLGLDSNSSMTASAASRILSKLLLCRCWWKFRRCRRRPKFAGHAGAPGSPQQLPCWWPF